jgi:cation:H+ antiporter
LIIDVLILLVGLVILVLGGEFLVKGAVGFSRTMRISPLVIGMTVVAFGTSAPELLVSLKSALSGNPGIAIGNVIGSNIANIALVLGVTVLIFPIVVDRHTKVIDYPVMIGATLLFYVFAVDGYISLVEGMIFVFIILVFTTLLIANSRKRTKKQYIEDDDPDNDHMHNGVSPHQGSELSKKKAPFWKSILFLHIGFVGLYFGADWFIEGAVSIADEFLIDNPDKDTIIGVTIVAFGTSAPELVASCVAAYRKETDISVGNLIGSNIFNIFVVLGITSIVTPIEVSPEAVHFDMMWMIGIAVLLFFILIIGKKIGRLKGAILVTTYITYLTIILLRVKGVI